MHSSPKESPRRGKTSVRKPGLSENASADTYFEGRADREIWDMFREGHIGAFRYIYITYFNLIFTYGCRITRDSELVKDCIQELFIELRKSQKISETQSIKFYLFRALRWKIYRKMERNERFKQIEDMSNGFEIDFDEPYESLMIRHQTSEINKAKLKSAISELTRRQREALYYFYDQKMDYQQVAEMMNLSNVKSARNIIYKSIKILRKALL